MKSLLFNTLFIGSIGTHPETLLLFLMLVKTSCKMLNGQDRPYPSP